MDLLLSVFAIALVALGILVIPRFRRPLLTRPLFAHFRKTRSITAAVTVMVPNSLGPAELLLRYGTVAQRDHYLPRLARGEEIPCFGLTGPEAGSDAASIPDSGVVCRGIYNGQEGLGVEALHHPGTRGDAHRPRIPVIRSGASPGQES